MCLKKSERSVSEFISSAAVQSFSPMSKKMGIIPVEFEIVKPRTKKSNRIKKVKVAGAVASYPNGATFYPNGYKFADDLKGYRMFGEGLPLEPPEALVIHS